MRLKTEQGSITTGFLNLDREGRLKLYTEASPHKAGYFLKAHMGYSQKLKPDVGCWRSFQNTLSADAER